MIDFKAARENMVESQVRPNGITDYALIDALSTVPREEFVPDELRSVAYMDADLTFPQSGRVLMAAMTYARLLQMAEISAEDCVLDVGCGLGYSTAVLCNMAQSVVAIDSDSDMATQAAENLNKMDYTNSAVLNEAHVAGCKAEGSF